VRLRALFPRSIQNGFNGGVGHPASAIAADDGHNLGAHLQFPFSCGQTKLRVAPRAMTDPTFIRMSSACRSNSGELSHFRPALLEPFPRPTPVILDV